MDKKRMNEIFSTLLEQNENVETAKLLKELQDGYEEPENNKKELEDLKTKYSALEQDYINTFKNSLSDEPEDNSAPGIEKAVENVEPQKTFEEMLFTEIKE